MASAGVAGAPRLFFGSGSMNDLQNASTSSDHAHDLLTLPSAPGRLACLRAIERKVLWLSTWMIHNANHLRTTPRRAQGGGPPGVVRLAGHAHDRALLRCLASPGPGCRQAACQPGLPRDPVPARPPAAGRSSSGFGPSAAPSHTHREPRTVTTSTSRPARSGWGLPSRCSRRWSQDYLRLKQLVPDDRPAGRMIALAGDAELDEGNVFEALLEGWKHDVRNVWWIIDYNRQSLDCVVEDRLFQRIDTLFRSMGWDVVTLKYGRRLQDGIRAARRRGAPGLDRQLPQHPVFGPGLPRRGRLAGPAEARPGVDPRHPRPARRARRRRAPRPDDEPRRSRHGVGPAGLSRRDHRCANLLHRLHDQGVRPPFRRPQGQPLRV